jgi:hypothetical protein
VPIGVVGWALAVVLIAGHAAARHRRGVHARLRVLPRVLPLALPAASRVLENVLHLVRLILGRGRPFRLALDGRRVYVVLVGFVIHVHRVRHLSALDPLSPAPVTRKPTGYPSAI